MAKSVDKDTIDQVTELLDIIEAANLSNIAKLSIWLALTQKVSATEPDLLTTTIFNMIVEGLCGDTNDFLNSTLVFTTAFDNVSRFIVENFDDLIEQEHIAKDKDDDFLN